MQNLAASVVTRSSKYSSITPTLKKLHWLPVKYRITFKVVLLTFKALYGMAPNYLKTAAKLHAFSLTEIREWKLTHHAESTPQIRMPYFSLCGSQVVERTTCEHYDHHLPCIIQIILKNSSFKRKEGRKEGRNLFI